MPRLAAVTVAVGLAIIVLAVASASAHAAPPPPGKYECVIGANSILFGNLIIRPGRKYAHRGTRGRFTGGASNLRFKGGDLGGMRGRWHRSSDGIVEIALRNPRDDFESIYCDKA